MSAEVMLAFLNQCSVEAKLGFRVVSHCAPVLKGIKVSNIITMERGTWRKLQNSLKGSNILCVLLSTDEEREVLLLYRYKPLEHHLKEPKVREFLNRYGYLDVSVAAVISRLRKRYAEYAAKRQEFPHELGVILEYPVEDVEGFIENQGKNFLTKRYWKVYHNQARAEALFAQYDRVRELAMEEIIAGYPLQAVAVS